MPIIPLSIKIITLILGSLIVMSPVVKKESVNMQYRGVVTDQLSKNKQYTKWVDTYKNAHDDAETLCSRTIGNRGTIDVEETKE